jgi:UDP-N-acetylmuramate--alanine ligase
LSDVQAAFAELVALVPEEGFIIANTKDSQVAPVLNAAKATVVDYPQYLNLMRPLRQPGLHNRLNAAAAEAAARVVGIEATDIESALLNFAGTARRFEYKGDVHNAPVYDDYAHNPQKVAAAIAGVRELHKGATLTAVFQPHTYSRTAALMEEFVAALATADRVILVPIYAARELPIEGINSEVIVKKLCAQGVIAEHFHTLEATALKVKESVGKNDVVIVMGAGTVTEVASLLTK